MNVSREMLSGYGDTSRYEGSAQIVSLRGANNGRENLYPEHSAD